jgi:hypothetical protein
MVTEARTAELSLIEATPAQARSGALATLKCEPKPRKSPLNPTPLP